MNTIVVISLIILGINAMFSLHIVKKLSNIIKEITTQNNEKIYNILELFTDGVLAKNIDEFAILRENAHKEEIKEEEKRITNHFVPVPSVPKVKPPTEAELETELFGK